MGDQLKEVGATRGDLGIFPRIEALLGCAARPIELEIHSLGQACHQLAQPFHSAGDAARRLAARVVAAELQPYTQDPVTARLARYRRADAGSNFALGSIVLM